MPSNVEPRITLVAIVGPTAIGKTALAVALAEKFHGEIVGADSRQIYRWLDIGTAKPSAEERGRVPHHLVDFVAPDDTLTLGQYKQFANDAIVEIARRRRLPFLVGGTGLYLRTVLEGWTIPEVAPDLALRERLLAEAQTLGNGHLHQKLQSVDPIAAQKVDARNVRRVIRYLEVYYATGEPISTQQAKQAPPYETLTIGLTLPRESLYRRIDARVEAMMQAGLLDEVRDLLARGYSPELPALSGFGYRQLVQHLRGDLSLADAVQETKKETRRFVRRQYAWFSLDDPSILWLRADSTAYDHARAAIESFLNLSSATRS